MHVCGVSGVIYEINMCLSQRLNTSAQYSTLSDNTDGGGDRIRSGYTRDVDRQALRIGKRDGGRGLVRLSLVRCFCTCAA